MAHFCNQFDLVCHELGAAVIYCHHHSKGTQGSKRSMDRASGSGVFARDPDALLDLIELDLTEALIKQEENKAVCKICIDFLDKYSTRWEDHLSQDDMCSEKIMLKACETYLTGEQQRGIDEVIKKTRKQIQNRTAWRIDGTLREFPKFKPVNMWFDYPIHQIDNSNSLVDAEAEGEKAPWQKAMEKRKPKEQKAKERKESFELAYQACSINGEVSVLMMEEYLGVTKNTVKNWAKEHGEFEIENGIIKKKQGIKKHKFGIDT